MNRITLILAVSGLCFAVGQGLQCYKCSFGIGSLCITSNITCESGELCYSGKVGTGDLKFKMKGCLKEADCNKIKNVTLPGSSDTTLYSINRTCCSTDLCNAAPGLPGTSGLSLAAVTIFSFLAANFII
ncbi:lymphocyte antigen 6 complex locus protein G6d-like [Cyprinodon tularosa]|uniref:Lymphocyte antigen-6, epidermis n=1 Tax=Cyprinodon variegatus TaxID=28743 RepID=A0A3Q2CAS4_CYPVA|nr:PREDICTED: lymphocyte antigen 6 complex locus protein G6d-like [Cyprinodon variegatus]XP_038132980.1 lymphocyte antigen 6 complex locus protein G6d-like [Cyprinodon tularosa]